MQSDSRKSARTRDGAGQPDVQDESREILDAVRRIVQALRVASRRTEALAGLSAAQVFVLQKLGDDEPASIGQLAERTCTHQSSVSAVVAKLTAAELVTRSPAVKDARRVELRLTTEGRRALRESGGSVQSELLQGLAHMSDARRSRLAELLHEWVQLAGLAAEHASMFLEEASEVDSSPKFSSRPSKRGPNDATTRG